MGSSKKHWKDVKSVTLWHISQENLTHLAPRSVFKGQPGLYFSESFRSLIDDWAPYVASKKYHKHSLDINWRKTWDQIDEIISKPEQDRTPEEHEQLESLKNKIDQMRESLNRSSHTDDKNKLYRTVFIHKVLSPEWLVRQSYRDMYQELDEEAKSGNINYGFWFWGSQVFITADNLKHLKLVSSKKYDYNEIWDLLGRPSYFD